MADDAVEERLAQLSEGWRTSPVAFKPPVEHLGD